MTAQLRAVPHQGPASSPLSFRLLRDRAGNAVSQLRLHTFRTRRELDALRSEVRQLEYIQQSLLRTADRILEVTGISLEADTGDGTAEDGQRPVASRGVLQLIETQGHGVGILGSEPDAR